MKKFAQFISLALVAVMCVALLASCAPASDPDKAVAALKDAGYVAGKDTGLSAFISALTGNKLSAVVSGTKTDDDKNLQTVYILYYETADDAKSAYESSALKKYFDDKKENKEETDYVYAKSGKMVYFGTKTAIKDAR